MASGSWSKRPKLNETADKWMKRYDRRDGIHLCRVLSNCVRLTSKCGEDCNDCGHESGSLSRNSSGVNGSSVSSLVSCCHDCRSSLIVGGTMLSSCSPNSRHKEATIVELSWKACRQKFTDLGPESSGALRVKEESRSKFVEFSLPSLENSDISLQQNIRISTPLRSHPTNASPQSRIVYKSAEECLSERKNFFRINKNCLNENPVEKNLLKHKPRLRPQRRRGYASRDCYSNRTRFEGLACPSRLIPLLITLILQIAQVSYSISKQFPPTGAHSPSVADAHSSLKLESPTQSKTVSMNEAEIDMTNLGAVQSAFSNTTVAETKPAIFPVIKSANKLSRPNSSDLGAVFPPTRPVSQTKLEAKLEGLSTASQVQFSVLANKSISHQHIRSSKENNEHPRANGHRDRQQQHDSHRRHRRHQQQQVGAYQEITATATTLYGYPSDSCQEDEGLHDAMLASNEDIRAKKGQTNSKSHSQAGSSRSSRSNNNKHRSNNSENGEHYYDDDNNDNQSANQSNSASLRSFAPSGARQLYVPEDGMKRQNLAGLSQGVNHIGSSKGDRVEVGQTNVGSGKQAQRWTPSGLREKPKPRNTVSSEQLNSHKCQHDLVGETAVGCNGPASGNTKPQPTSTAKRPAPLVSQNGQDELIGSTRRPNIAGGAPSDRTGHFEGYLANKIELGHHKLMLVGGGPARLHEGERDMDLGKWKKTTPTMTTIHRHWIKGDGSSELVDGQGQRQTKNPTEARVERGFVANSADDEAMVLLAPLTSGRDLGASSVSRQRRRRANGNHHRQLGKPFVLDERWPKVKQSSEHPTGSGLRTNDYDGGLLGGTEKAIAAETKGTTSETSGGNKVYQATTKAKRGSTKKDDVGFNIEPSIYNGRRVSHDVPESSGAKIIASITTTVSQVDTGVANTTSVPMAANLADLDPSRAVVRQYITKLDKDDSDAKSEPHGDDNIDEYDNLFLLEDYRQPNQQHYQHHNRHRHLWKPVSLGLAESAGGLGANDEPAARRSIGREASNGHLGASDARAKVMEANNGGVDLLGQVPRRLSRTASYRSVVSADKKPEVQTIYFGGFFPWLADEANVAPVPQRSRSSQLTSSESDTGSLSEGADQNLASHAGPSSWNQFDTTAEMINDGGNDSDQVVGHDHSMGKGQGDDSSRDSFDGLAPNGSHKRRHVSRGARVGQHFVASAIKRQAQDDPEVGPQFEQIDLQPGHRKQQHQSNGHQSGFGVTNLVAAAVAAAAAAVASPAAAAATTTTTTTTTSNGVGAIGQQISENRHRLGKFILPAVRLALDHINNNRSVLGSYKLEVVPRDTQCNATISLKQFFDMVYEEPKKMLLYGDACRVSTDPIAKASYFFDLVQISYADTDPIYTIENYPNFFRVVPSENALSLARIPFIRHFNWTRVGTIYQNLPRYSLPHSKLLTGLERFRIVIKQSVSLPGSVDGLQNRDLGDELRKLKEKDIRIILGNFDEEWALLLFCEAFREKMIGRKYQWLLTGFSEAKLWTYYETKGSLCTKQELLIAMDGYIITDITPVTRSQQRTISGMMAHEYSNEYRRRAREMNVSIEDNKFYGYVYDGIWAIALALNRVDALLKHYNQLAREGRVKLKAELVGITSLLDFEYHKPIWVKLIRDALNKTKFYGVTGTVSFHKNERPGLITLSQFQAFRDTSEVVIGSYDALTDQLDLKVGVPIYWRGSSPPIDHTIQRVTPFRINRTIFVIISIMATLGIVLACIFLFVNIKFRNQRYIKMSSPYLNNLIIIGCILTFTSVIILGLDSGLTSEFNFPYICNARAWVLMAGFTLAFGSMFSKTFRVHSIFTNIKLHKKVIKDYKLFMVVFILLTFDVCILIVWQYFDPFYRETNNGTSIQDPDNEDVIIVPEMEHCQSKRMTIFLTIIYVYKGLLMAFGCFLAWETRHVSIPALNDSKYIGLSVYNVVIMCVIGASLSFILRDQQDASFVIISIFIIFCSTATLCLVFVPKVRMLIELKQNPRAGDHRVRATLKTFKKNYHEEALGAAAGCGTGNLIGRGYGIPLNDKIKLLLEENVKQRSLLKEKTYELEALTSKYRKIQGMVQSGQYLQAINTTAGPTPASLMLPASSCSMNNQTTSGSTMLLTSRSPTREHISFATLSKNPIGSSGELQINHHHHLNCLAVNNGSNEQSTLTLSRDLQTGSIRTRDEAIERQQQPQQEHYVDYVDHGGHKTYHQEQGSSTTLIKSSIMSSVTQLTTTNTTSSTNNATDITIDYSQTSSRPISSGASNSNSNCNNINQASNQFQKNLIGQMDGCKLNQLDGRKLDLDSNQQRRGILRVGGADKTIGWMRGETPTSSTTTCYAGQLLVHQNLDLFTILTRGFGEFSIEGNVNGKQSGTSGGTLKQQSNHNLTKFQHPPDLEVTESVANKLGPWLRGPFCTLMMKHAYGGSMDFGPTTMRRQTSQHGQGKLLLAQSQMIDMKAKPLSSMDPQDATRIATLTKLCRNSSQSSKSLPRTLSMIEYLGLNDFDQLARRHERIWKKSKEGVQWVSREMLEGCNYCKDGSELQHQQTTCSCSCCLWSKNSVSCHLDESIMNNNRQVLISCRPTTLPVTRDKARFDCKQTKHHDPEFHSSCELLNYDLEEFMLGTAESSSISCSTCCSLASQQSYNSVDLLQRTQAILSDKKTRDTHHCDGGRLSMQSNSSTISTSSGSPSISSSVVSLSSSQTTRSSAGLKASAHLRRRSGESEPTSASSSSLLDQSTSLRAPRYCPMHQHLDHRNYHQSQHDRRATTESYVNQRTTLDEDCIKSDENKMKLSLQLTTSSATTTGDELQDGSQCTSGKIRGAPASEENVNVALDGHRKQHSGFVSSSDIIQDNCELLASSSSCKIEGHPEPEQQKTILEKRISIKCDILESL